MTPLPHLHWPTEYSRHLARLILARPELQHEICAAAPLDAALLHAWLGEAPLTEDNRVLAEGRLSADSPDLELALPAAREQVQAHLTQRGLTIVDVRPAKNLLLIRGAVPGSRNGIVEVRTDG